MRALFLTLIASFALCGCASGWVRQALNPAMLAGSDAGEFIDGEAGDLLAARYPEVPIGQARCPTLILLSADRITECTIPIGDRALRIGVTGDDPRDPSLVDRDALIARPALEDRVARYVALGYGVHFTVHCDVPEIGVIALGSELECTGNSPGGGLHTLEVMVIDRTGDVTTPSLEGFSSRATVSLGADVAEAKFGGVRFPGARLERYLVDEVVAEYPSLTSLHLLRGARCPRVIAVDPTTRTTCVVEAGSARIRYDVRFDRGAGLRVTTNGAILVVPVVREQARRALSRLFRRVGERDPILGVTCGRDTVVVRAPGADLRCIVRQPHGNVPILVRVTRDDGSFVLRPGDEDE